MGKYGEIWGIRDIGDIWVWKLVRGWIIGWLEKVGICGVWGYLGGECGGFGRF